ncbi:MAG: pirin family protein [Kiritimatiellales bacterium]|nr:pirin family protein [Kiritimatiellales bacterium]MCF7863534.1 pirin family protein [Kiritimatiellales bacterium]
MITVRKSNERGHADHGWLKTFHSFSFASYFDPAHMKFRSLRVINEDWIKGGEGFGTHPHDNMEIITYIIEGELEHKDSMGNGSVIRRGELQRMTAGTGVTHSEFNPTNKETHLLQIWIMPERAGLEPGYEQRDFSNLRKPNELTLLASQTGKDESLMVHQDVALYGGELEEGRKLHYTLESDRHIWIQMIEGSIDINGTELNTGDGAAIDEESLLAISALRHSEFLLFDLA